jgi:alpha-beta hydrolase superfamily lysophospholipase
MGWESVPKGSNTTITSRHKIIQVSDRRVSERRRHSLAPASEFRVQDRRQLTGSKADRRATPRFSQNVPSLITMDDFSNAERFETLDISARGLRLRSPKEFPIGAKAHLCIFPPGYFEPVQLEGEIRWRRLDIYSKDYFYGLAFTNIPFDYQAVLSEFLAELSDPRIGKRSKTRRSIKKILYERVIKSLLKQSFIGRRGLLGRSDSGATFEYIYSAHPEGRGKIGRWIDAVLLKLPAAEASRLRKDLIRDFLKREIHQNMADGRLTKIVDLASGAARYLTEAIGFNEAPHVQALCLDRDRESISLGRKIAGQKPLRFVRMDIFKTARLEHIAEKARWTPNVVIASGLIYYLPDVEVKKLFSRVYRWLEFGGLFVVTNMIKNPNKDLIGHLFVQQDGNAWIPLARSPHLVRTWLDEIGFENIKIANEPVGMYSIFAARKEQKPVRNKAFEFLCKEGVIRGKLFLPIENEAVKAYVLFVHGLGYTHSSYSLDPKIFCDKGMGVAVFNMRGHASSPGEWELNEAAEDVRRAIDKLASLGNRPKPVFLFAHSTGGLIAMLASQKHSRVQGASLVNIVNSVTDSYLHWHRSGYNQRVKEFFKSNGIVPPIINAFLDDPNVMRAYQNEERPWSDLDFPYRYGLMRSKTFRFLAQAICYSPDLKDFARQIKFPVLLFSGMADEIIPVEKCVEIGRQLTVQHNLIKTDSNNHFQTDRWDLIQSETAQFFTEGLGSMGEN